DDTVSCLRSLPSEFIVQIPLLTNTILPLPFRAREAVGAASEGDSVVAISFEASRFKPVPTDRLPSGNSAARRWRAFIILVASSQLGPVVCATNLADPPGKRIIRPNTTTTVTTGP